MSSLSLDTAARLLEGAEAEARRIGIPMSLAAVDSGGHLLCFRRMDGAPWIGAEVAIGKAYTAAAYGMPTRQKAERARELLPLTNAIIAMSHGRYVPQDGGLPVFFDDVLVGGLGASGGTGEQDERALLAGLGQAL